MERRLAIGGPLPQGRLLAVQATSPCRDCRDVGDVAREKESTAVVPCELIANRFVRVDDRHSLDLATGARVLLQVIAAGDAASERRWAVRCDTLHTLHHRAIVPLVDYGLIGTAERFEAWSCGGPWSGARQASIDTARIAERFLRANGLTVGALGSSDRVRHGTAGALVLPDEATGYPTLHATAPHGDETTIEDCGLQVIPRQAADAVAELFEPIAASRTRAIALWGPPSSGVSTTTTQLAREARLRGYVPVRARLLETPVADALGGLSLLIIDESRAHGWRSLLDMAVRSPRPHILLVVGHREIEMVDNVALERVSAERLANAIRPAALPSRLKNRIARAADGAHGWPGRFARALWGAHPSAARLRAGRRHGSRAAEQRAGYGVEPEPIVAGSTGAGAWPSPGELAALRRRAQQGAQLAERGRHAPGERLLRQSAAGLARRDDWTHASRAALALATSIAARGRTSDAQGVLAEARRYATRAGDEGASIDVAVRSGHVWIDLGRLDEAETALSAARSAARASGDQIRTAGVALAIARCLFWRGRYADAQLAISDLEAGGLVEPALIHRAMADSRAAVGERDFSRGVTAAAEALQRAIQRGDPSCLARAACASAFAHLAVEDHEAVERDVILAVASARRARDPLRALRARLLLAESTRRRGGRSTALSLVHRLKTVRIGLPPIVKARRDLLADLLAASGPPGQVVERHVAATGLPALALFAPAAPRTTGVTDLAVDEIVGILSACQSADEDASRLSDVCARLRRQLDAAAVAFVGGEPSAPWAPAADGSRVDPAMAWRAIAAGMAIAPHRVGDRLEAAVPVRYGGQTIGALVARWTLGTMQSPGRAVPLLTMAAAAAAPTLSAARNARGRTAAAPPVDFLGVSATTVELRRAVERAAPAPYAVLIEGESGSGKELIARAVHRRSPRRERQICTLNCAALPDDLIEAELFGHARGAFTGAVGERAGVFEEAHGGTLFLDEVGELSARAQAKLLRVIQEGELRRVGENTSRRVDVRIISATNRDLREEVAAGRFRLDLLYRLDVIRIGVEPLRARRDDIPVLAEQIWQDAAARVGSRAVLSAATMAALARYDWPGNVRELQNVLAALAVRSSKRGVVPATALPAQFCGASGPADEWRLEHARRVFDERFVRAALVRSGGRRARAAAELGVTRQGLAKLMARLGIDG